MPYTGLLSKRPCMVGTIDDETSLSRGIPWLDHATAQHNHKTIFSYLPGWSSSAIISRSSPLLPSSKPSKQHPPSPPFFLSTHHLPPPDDECVCVYQDCPATRRGRVLASLLTVDSADIKEPKSPSRRAPCR